MPLVSGYTGSLTWTGTESDVIFAPATTDVKLQSWSIRQTTDEFGVSVKGDSWETTFGTASEWSATATYLLQDTIVAAGLSVEIRGASSGPKTFNGTFVTTTGESYTGIGFVTGMTTEDPLDGPVTVTVELEGDGKLEFAGTG